MVSVRLFLFLYLALLATYVVAGEAFNVAEPITTAPALDYHPVRSPAARTAFMKADPCPANGKTRGACPGYVVDHIKPLCAGGADAPHNMQWQTLAEAKIKDIEERRQCRALQIARWEWLRKPK